MERSAWAATKAGLARGARAGLLLAGVVLAGCGGTPEPEPNPLGPPPPDSAQPAAVWAYLEGADYRRYWAPETGRNPAIHRSRPGHGPLIQTFVNRTADDARPLGKEPLPTGSVLVLENHTTEPHLHAIDVMAKIPGHNPDTNNWAFLRFGPTGTVKVSDAEARRAAREENRGCIHCHSRTAETDFLYKPRLER